ncbi:beta-glucosidase [Nocardioides sp.]|uniref:beta-glucosidase family protein n=1 Tax=Nocardioides sp. TaxID=35761 RepID=UPI003519BE44
MPLPPTRTRRLLVASALAVPLTVGTLAPGTVPAASARPAACAAWMDPRDSADERAEALVAAMSTTQKLHMVTFGDTPPYLLYYGTAGHVTGIPELCVPDLVLSDAGSGVAGLQIGTTTFPSGVAQASTWNTDLQREVGRVIGREAHRKGINVMLGPGMNIARTPYNGRNFEYFGEDPHLAAEMTVPFIRGIQDNPVIADAKHYALNDQETDRQTVDVRVDERTAREIYLAPFEAAVTRADVGSVMCSYNRVAGEYACENEALLTDVLREDWSFDGFVVSDWGAVHSTAASAMAGLDLEMHAVPFATPATPVFGAGGRYFDAASMRPALASGAITRARLDEMVRNIVRPMFREGLFERSTGTSLVRYLADVSTRAHRRVATRVASEGTVLLKNRGDLLPLAPRVAGGRTIAVIGYAANPVGAASTTAGGGSSHGSGLPPRTTSLLTSLLARAADTGDRILYAEGSSVIDAQLIASLADLAIVVAADGSTEAADRNLSMQAPVCASLLCLNLPVDQERMVEAVVAANPNNVVVLDTGGPVRMPWLDDAGAVLLPWFGGIQHGESLARIVYGVDEPSGRLPQTLPRSIEQNRFPRAAYPGIGGVARYSERLEIGYRWYDAHRASPLFPFGFGLGYSTFRYSDLTVTPDGRGAVVAFRVRNTGDRTAAAVPQVYVEAPRAAGSPPRELRGFTKLTLRPGESRTVRIRLGERAFSQWSVRAHDWRITPGTYGVRVGSHSRDLPLRGVVRQG